MITTPIPFRYYTEPYLHQDLEFKRSRSLKYFAAFWEMGTGKSKLIIDTIADLYCRKEIDGAILIGDKGNYLNWRGEIATHLHPDIRRRIGPWGNSSRDQRALEEVMRAEDDTLDFFLLNIEALSGERAEVAASRFIRSHYCLIAVDEATSIKNYKAQRTKSAVRLGKMCDYRRILTGTPVTQGPLDLYPMCEFLEKGLLGFPTFTSFKSHFTITERVYLGPNRPQFDKIIGYKNLEHLTTSLDQFSSRITKDECLDLPPKSYQVYDVELSPEQKNAYESLRQTAVLQLEQGLLASTSVLTTINKLQQICCGHVKLDENTQVDLPNNRLDDLLTVLETIGNQQKVIIWCAFQRDVELIVARIREWKKNPAVVVDYYGKTDHEKRQQNLEQFRDGQVTQYFVGTAATGGKGITLTCASYVVYYSNTYSLEDRLQSEDRAHRIGQSKNVTYIDLVCRGTVDEKVLESLKRKEDLAYQVLDKARELLT